MISSISFGALPPRTHYISENLIIGAKQGVAGLRQLRDEEAVNRVIDLRNGHPIKKLKEFLTCKMLGIKYSSHPMIIGDRHPLNIKDFDYVHSAITDNVSGKTYVHCNCGLHRSLLVAAYKEIRAGKIKSLADLSDFLSQRNYFKLNKKVRYGIKVPLSPEDVRYRTENLEYQKRSLWGLANQ